MFLCSRVTFNKFQLTNLSLSNTWNVHYMLMCRYCCVTSWTEAFLSCHWSILMQISMAIWWVLVLPLPTSLYVFSSKCTMFNLAWFYVKELYQMAGMAQYEHNCTVHFSFWEYSLKVCMFMVCGHWVICIYVLSELCRTVNEELGQRHVWRRADERAEWEETSS